MTEAWIGAFGVAAFWFVLLRRLAKALGWRRFATRAIGAALQSAGTALALPGLYSLGSAARTLWEIGVWNPTTLGQGLNDHRWFYPETGRWASETLPGLIADLPLGLVLIVLGLAVGVIGGLVFEFSPALLQSASRAGGNHAPTRS